MTNKELMQAKDNYQELLKERELFIRKKEQFLDFVLNDNYIQEFLILEDWEYFEKRYYELMQENTVRQYLYLMAKYNNFEEKNDNELVDMAFRSVIKESESNNIFVYLGSYTFDDSYKKIEVANGNNDIFYEYINLETARKKIIPFKEIKKFKKNNRIIIFKNKHHKPIDLFYQYRAMYLRQFLLGNNEHLFNNSKIKGLKVPTKK